MDGRTIHTTQPTRSWMIIAEQRKRFEKNPIKGTKYTIAISSAKGGVGKSTFATNLALALKNLNLKIGLLDADIYGPSLPKLFAINQKPENKEGKLIGIIIFSEFELFIFDIFLICGDKNCI